MGKSKSSPTPQRHTASNDPTVKLAGERGLEFVQQLRSARYAVLAHGEDASQLLFAFERLGAFLLGSIGTLKNYGGVLSILARGSPLHAPRDDTYQTRFPTLFESVMHGRNEALHQGAFARSLDQHAVQMALVLEDAIMSTRIKVGDYMVRNPVTAAPWQPIMHIRHTMLANSFSFLPIERPAGRWQLVADDDVARFLRVDNHGNAISKDVRDQRLAMTLDEAIELHNFRLRRAPHKLGPNARLPELFRGVDDGRPALVVRADGRRETLLGIITTFDLL